MTRCPGCGVELPRGDATYDGYFHTTPECWAVYGRVLEREYGDPALFEAVHQLTVDAYAVQHAGGPHPDKSVDVHLFGLYLVLERGFPPAKVPAQLQALVATRDTWPHFEPPATTGPLTAIDVTGAGPADEHVALVRAWAEQVWAAWRPYHAEIVALA